MTKDYDQLSLWQEAVTQLREMNVVGLPNRWFEQEGIAVPEEMTIEKSVFSEQPTLEVTKEVKADGPYSSLNMEQLEKLCSTCAKCRLSETRNKVVFGAGKICSPLIAFVGEGPGAEEDKQGEPFVGKAGVLLTAAITKGLGLRREDVYIANVVKCRPPENRVPLPDEVASCTPYLYRQLELLRPKVIVTLGAPAQLALSGVNTGITKLRGKWLEWRGIKLMPTFHPAYILRNPAAKRDFWQDLQKVMLEVGLTGSASTPANNNNQREDKGVDNE